MIISSIALAALIGGFIARSAFSDPKPNFIVMQPDDLQFYEEWNPPPHYPKNGNEFFIPVAGLPNIERLRENGLQMDEAYTSSAKCGTSRYSTITGRYPSRSSFGRDFDFGETVRSVTIPRTKLDDVSTVEDGNDCSESNLAAIFSQNNYRTGMVGKWHLTKSDSLDGGYNYTNIQDEIRECGFNYAEAIYAENMGGSWMNSHADPFHHNLEYITLRAIEFISENASEPFFLYFNPTAPHGPSVEEALTNYTCLQTPEGNLTSEPYVPGMTDGKTCSVYRESIFNRSSTTTNQELGALWVDDSIGAILQTLEDNSLLNNTFFLFQMDHGQEGKDDMYEPGTRIAQFIHFPDQFGTDGRHFSGIVSTVDIGPTMLDYAGIDSESTGYYEMDGTSWRTAVENDTVADDWKLNRCLAFELGEDRAVRCGCDKYIKFTNDTVQDGNNNGVAMEMNVLFNLCDEYSQYDDYNNSEVIDIAHNDTARLQELQNYMECHLEKTKPSVVPLYTDCTIDEFNGFPTGSPSSFPSSTATECIDVSSFEDDSNVTRTCAWAAGRANRCKLSTYGTYCPVSCGLCGSLAPTVSISPSSSPTVCVDAPDNSFTDKTNSSRTCAWVLNQTNGCRLNRYGALCPVSCLHCNVTE